MDEHWDAGYEVAFRYRGRNLPAYAIYLRYRERAWDRAQRVAFMAGILCAQETFDT